MIELSSLDLAKMSPEEIGELLIEAKKAYYTTGKPLMDDHTYDTLEEILRTKYPHHRIFSKIGNENFNTGFQKKQHSMPMGSQNKVTSFEELVHYFQLKNIPPDTDFITQPKCDGISLEIEYKDGKLVDAITRGDGHVGDVITQNVVKMNNFCEVLPLPFTGSIRCEVVVTYKNFDRLNRITGNLYSNPRNAAAGISQRLDRQYADFCSLYAVDLYDPDGNTIKTEMDKLDKLNQLNVVTVETHLSTNIQEIETIYQKFLDHKRQEYPFDIDGLVVKINDLSLQHSLGSHANRPKGQVAYKFPYASDQTRIQDIVWQVGPMGSVTPVAKVDPVEISGAIINFASLANPNLIAEKNINIGDIVEISRRGDVIPHIESVVSKVNPGFAKPPHNCPSCNTPLIHQDKSLECPNFKTCPAQILGSLNLFIKTLDIKNISEKTIAKLYESNKVKLPGDFYDLTVDNFVNLEGLGQKSGANIVSEIQAKRRLTLRQAFDAAAIPSFSSQRIAAVIEAGFNTPQKIINLTASDLKTLPGFQSTLANKIITGIKGRLPFIRSILDHVTIKTPSTKGNSLQGRSIAITGDLSRPRKQITFDIEAAGGKVVSSVTKNTDYLITNEKTSSSSKFKNAQKLGTKIITEEELYQQL